MKQPPVYLAGMLMASLALVQPGVSWSQTASNKKPVEKAKSVAKPDVHKKTALAQKKAPAAKAKPVVTATHQNPALQNPYLPGSSASVKSVPNPYLPDSQPQAAAANPYLPKPAAALAGVAAVAAPAAIAAATPAPVQAPPLSLSLSQSLSHAPAQTPPTKAPEAVAGKPVQAAAVAAPAPLPYQPAPNPYLMNSYAYNQAATLSNPLEGMSLTLTDISQFLPSLPSMPSLADVSILPTLKKVYPTGEKPLYVLTFKCPTEVIGITPIPTKALHWLVTAGMDALNATDLLPFNMQQVCQ